MNDLEHANDELVPFRMGLETVTPPYDITSIRDSFKWRKGYVSLQRKF